MEEREEYQKTFKYNYEVSENESIQIVNEINSLSKKSNISFSESIEIHKLIELKKMNQMLYDNFGYLDDNIGELRDAISGAIQGLWK